MTGASGHYVYRYKQRAADAQSLLDLYLAHFSSNPVRDGLVYGVLIVVAALYATASFYGLVFDTSKHCDDQVPTELWPNPEYNPDPCLDRRYWQLLFLSPRMARHYRHLIVSLVLGSVIGYERRSPDRPAGPAAASCLAASASFGFCTILSRAAARYASKASDYDASAGFCRMCAPPGIRTMALVCLGACSFTVSSQWAFQVSPMSWDAARVSAAIPSGQTPAHALPPPFLVALQI